MRKVTPAGVISTMVGSGPTGHANGSYGGDGGPATLAQLNLPIGLALDSAGNLYIADSFNNRIRKVTPAGVIITVAGSGPIGSGTGSFSGDGGPGTSAQLGTPSDVAVDAASNLYIADSFNHRIRKLTASGVISTIAGNGIAGFAGDGGAAICSQLNVPGGLAVDAAGGVYIADIFNNRVRRITF